MNPQRLLITEPEARNGGGERIVEWCSNSRLEEWRENSRGLFRADYVPVRGRASSFAAIPLGASV